MSHGFENLIVWQRARASCGAVWPVVKAARAEYDFKLSQELNGSSISIMSNIAEGHLRRYSYIAPATFERLCTDSVEIGRMLEALRTSVQKQEDPGTRWSPRWR
jgi:hypothetical protein